MSTSMRILLSAICLCVAGSGSFAFAEDQGRSRLEDLFMWKVSEHLELSAEEDSSFRKIVKDLNEKKAKANEEMKKIVSHMEKEKLSGKKAMLTKDYQKQLKLYTDYQLEEMESLKEVFGEAKLADYIIVKTKLTENLKVLMGSGESRKKPTIGKPKVEIEK